MEKDMTIGVSVDIRSFDEAMRQMEERSESFGRQFAKALGDAAIQGRSLEDTLRRIGLSLAGSALQQALAPAQNLAGGLISGAFSGLRNILGFANGGVPGRVQAFADGGVVSSPTFFPLGGDLGLMGEAGAEAILPLSRGSDGRLGVAAADGRSPVSIVFNVTSPDAASFRKSEAQITGMIARAAMRGTRSL